MPKMTEQKLVSLVNGEFQDGMGSESGQIGAERALAWDYYLGKQVGDLAKEEDDGRSSVVTSDVADVVDGMMPSLLRIFTSADNLVEFEPVGSAATDPQVRAEENQQDEEQAAQASDYVNYVFFKKNPAFLILYTWFFDALVQKNGIVKAWWDKSEVVTTESYEGLSEMELAELLEDDELEPIERDEREAETVAEDGFTIIRATVHDVTFKRTTKRGYVCVENIPPEEYRISSDSRSLIPEGARMVGHERPMTRSELLEMGFDKELVEELPADDPLQDTREEQARKDKTDDNDLAPHDRSQDKITVREAYIKVDWDGDGRSELRQVYVANSKLLSNEEIDRQPFHVISPQPLPHKHFGRALAEKVMDLQRVNSTLVRQVLDNLYHTNNPSHAVWEQGIGENTLDDLLTTRVGSIKRFARPVGESYSQIQVPFTAAATFPMLEFWEKAKRDRTGIASDGEGLSPEALKNIQTTVMAQSVDLSRMKIEAVVRIFAETGLKSLFRHIHELLLKHQDKPEVVRLRNKWVEVNPQEWRTRENMTVTIGLGIGTREQNLLHLNAIWEKQAAMVQAGGMNLTVTPRNIYSTASEFVKNANLKNPDQFFTDPGDQKAPPPSTEQQQLQKQQQALAQREQMLDAERQQFQSNKLQLQAQKDQAAVAKMISDHQVDVEKLALQRQEQENKLLIAMEQIATKLTELELASSQNVPGSKV